MTLQQIVLLALQASIFLTVFGFGLQADWSDVLYLVRRPGTLARSLVAMFIIMPVVAVLIGITFELHQAVAVALVALAISPIPPMLPKRERSAGGRSAYAIGLMATAAVLSIAFIPLALDVLGQVRGSPVATVIFAVARLALMSVLVPLAAGILLRSVAPSVASRLVKPVAAIATVLLASGALVILSRLLPIAFALVGNGTVLFIALFIVIGLLVGHVLGGTDPEERSVLALSTACRHPAIALAIAGATYPGEGRVGGAIALYLLLNLAISVPYMVWQRRAGSAGMRTARV